MAGVVVTMTMSMTVTVIDGELIDGELIDPIIMVDKHINDL